MFGESDHSVNSLRLKAENRPRVSRPTELLCIHHVPQAASEESATGRVDATRGLDANGWPCERLKDTQTSL